ncbi:MAG TPA: patatin-like phospholipase family protein [Streptosporangiaceae bacterium]|nr:patatin-like phospholipase family protein [Streptosporangiaceae bacterium]
MEAKHADLVLQGGGVRGIGLAGAVQALARDGYRFPRIAGTSAGAITGALVAALEKAGEPLGRLRDIALTADYPKFAEKGRLARLLGPLSPVGDALSLIFTEGLFSGDRLREWIAGALADLGVAVFGDLRLPDDPGGDLPPAHRYRLVAVVTDVSRRRPVMLPWDYPLYGLDPDEQPVADAVLASASIPFYFRPVRLRPAGGTTSTLVDGGVFWNYPISIFDRTDGRPPRWPTFGVRLVQPDAKPAVQPVTSTLALALGIAGSVYDAWDKMAVGVPCDAMRSMSVDTLGISATDFGITAAQQQELFSSGEAAAASFTEHWDFQAYLRDCRGGAP